MVDCFALLLNGDILNAAVCPFIAVPYFGGFFYMLLILALEMAIYIKTEDIMMPSILGVLLAASSFALPGVFIPAMFYSCLLYTSPSPRDRQRSRMPSSA